MDLLQELHALMTTYRFRPEKRFGQHFVVNAELVERLVSAANLDAKDTVLEIGAGTGFLTRELLKHSHVIAVEKDEKMLQILRETIPQKGLRLVEGSFLTADLPPFNKVVALPPYSISRDIIYRLSQLDFDCAWLVFQDEFAQKLVALPGFAEYNAVSVLANYFFEPSIEGNRIGPASFYPKPKAFSVVVKLVSRKRFGMAADEPMFRLVVQTLFRFRNKDLRNALKKAVPFLKGSGFSRDAVLSRAERLPFLDQKVSVLEPKQFVELFNRIARG